MLLNRIGHFTDSFDFLKYFVRKLSTKCNLKFASDFQPLKRIQPQVRNDVGIARQFACSILGNRTDSIKHDVKNRNSRLFFFFRLAIVLGSDVNTFWLANFFPCAPLSDDLECAFHEFTTTSVSLHFSARSLGHTVVFYQNDRVGRQFMFIVYAFSNLV